MLSKKGAKQLLAVLSMLLAAPVFGQNYPVRTIRFLTVDAGGAPDLVARFIAQGISGPLGQPVVVENRGGSVVQGEVVSKAPPDGYTLLMHGTVFWTQPLLDKTPYDVVKDFAPIALATRGYNLLVVNPALPVKSVKELIALAKAKPGEINYGSSPTGSTDHIAGELFKSMAGVNMVRVPYKGTGIAMNGLLAGEVQVMFIASSVIAPQVKAGKVRALAVTSAQPSDFFPDLPTVAASGLPGYEAGSMIGAFAPAQTPPAIINRLNQEINNALTQADIKKRILDLGVAVGGGTPEQFAAAIKSDMTRLATIIKQGGIKVEQ